MSTAFLKSLHRYCIHNSHGYEIQKYVEFWMTSRNMAIPCSKRNMTSTDDRDFADREELGRGRAGKEAISCLEEGNDPHCQDHHQILTIKNDHLLMDDNGCYHPPFQGTTIRSDRGGMRSILR